MLRARTHTRDGSGETYTLGQFSLRRYSSDSGVQYELGYILADGAFDLHEKEQQGNIVCLTVWNTHSGDEVTFENVEWTERLYEECDPIVVIRTRETDPVALIESYLGDRDTYTILDAEGTSTGPPEY